MSPRSALLVAMPALVVACASPGPGTQADVASPRAVTAPPPPVERLLELSKIESIVSARAPAFTRRVALMAGDLTDPELERLVPSVRDAFSAERLRADVADFIAAEAPEGTIGRVVALLEGGASADMTRLTEGYEPLLTLEAYARALPDDPPSEARVRVMVEWARVQGAGDFFVLLDQALVEAAHTVVEEFRPGSPAFRPLSGDPLFEQLETSLNAAVVSFLYRLAPVPDEVLRRAAAEYAGADGQWYVETYSLAVAQAIRAAGSRTVAALRASDG